MIDQTELKISPEEMAALPEETQKIIKGLQRLMAKFIRFEIKINKLRSKGLFPGKPGDPINIGQVE